jgi:Flp pilus assembly protein TadG
MRPDPYPAPSRHAQRGAVVIELLFICVFLATILFGAFVAGRVLWQYNTLLAATQAGARYLSAGPWTDQRMSDTEQLIQDLASGAQLTGVTVMHSCYMNWPKGCVDTRTELTELDVDAPVADPTGFLGGAGASLHIHVAVRNSY